MNLQAQNQQQHTENVVKFLLKLRNNTMQNLKNALRKLAEKTQGNKDQLLLRLAQKLATEDGRQMVKQFFKPEIYHELYEVDVYSNGNKNNSVYQYYRNMIPQNMQYPSSGTVTAGPVSQPPPMKPNDIMTNTSTANGGVAAPAHSMQQKKNQAVIEIDDDDNGGGGAQVVQQPSSMPNGDQLINGTDQLPVIPSQMAPIGSPNLLPDAPVMKDLNNNLKIDQISTSDNYPTILDENSLAGTSPIYCFCDSYNSEFYRGSNQRQAQKLIQCVKCKRYSHLDCQEQNKSMRQSKIGFKLEFNCHMCQFMALDPLAIPIGTIMRPFKMMKLRQEQAAQRNAHVKKTMKEYVIKESWFSQINPRRPGKSSIRIQVRCLRLDGIGYEHCFPKFGFMQVNDTRNQQEFKIPDPPNHEKKRKDDIHDITSISIQGRNLINIFQTQKDHKGFYAHPGHIIAVFLVKIIQPQDIVNFIKIKRTEIGSVSLRRYQEFFGGEGSTDQDLAMVENQETEQVTINLADSITMLPITVPARGEICTHLQCFDLETYITMNAKHKRWLCPFCNKRSSYVMIDPFFKYILDEMKPLRDTVLDIDDKIIMHKDLAIVFTRDKGKFYRKYDAQRQEGECTGYIAVNANSTGVVQKQIAASNSTPALGGGQINSNGTTGAEQPSTEASNNQTDGQNSQNNDSILGKRKAQPPVGDTSEEPPAKKKHTEDDPIELD